MKNWKIIMWLILFFPIGLYLMFKHSNWSKPVKYGVSGLFALVALAGGLELWVSLIFLTSIGIIAMSIASFIKNRNRKQSVGILLLGVILFAFSYQYTVVQEAEQARIEQQEQEAKEEKERLAEEARQREIAKKEEEKRIEEEEKLKKQIASAIEKVNEEPTEANYLKAMALLDQLDNSDNQFVKELEELKPVVDEYEENLKIAREAVEQAELDLNRQSHTEASERVSALSSPNKSLEKRLEDLDSELTDIEEKEEKERLAQEKEAAEKVAKEQAQQKAQQESKAKAAESVPEANTERVVYIAPESGTKYHFSANCRGLSNANSVKKVDLSVAKSQGYSLCGWED